MWDINYIGINLFDLFYCFFIYCFVGWIWECCYCSVCEGKLINRGFLNGPVIPIYGCAATGIFLAFFNDRMQWVTLDHSFRSYVYIFLIGAVVASALEYITSFVMEKMFHAKWWDYSGIPLNLKGRICLPVSMFWGALSILLVKVLHPAVLGLIAVFPRPLFEHIGHVVIFLFGFDIITTVIATISLDHKITALTKIKDEFYDLAGAVRRIEVDSKNNFKEKYGETIVGDVIEHGMDRIDATIAFMMQGYDEHKDEFDSMIDDKITKIDKVLAKNKVRLDSAVENGKNKYDDFTDFLKKGIGDIISGIKGYTKYTAHRFTTAFPSMKFMGLRADVVDEIKENMGYEPNKKRLFKRKGNK